MFLPLYLILIKNNEPYLSRSYDSQFAEFLYDCYLNYAFVFSTSLLVAVSRYGSYYYFAHLFSLLLNNNIILLIFPVHFSLKNVVFIIISFSHQFNLQIIILEAVTYHSHKLKASGVPLYINIYIKKHLFFVTHVTIIS